MKSQRNFVRLLPFAGAALAAMAAGDAYGEWAAHGGHVMIPDSSIEAPEHVGLRAHTNLKMFVPSAGPLAAQRSPARPETGPQLNGPPYGGYFYETPASLACVYQLVSPQEPGCDPNSVTLNPTGGARAIAIVDAYDYPTAISDLALFSAQFGLPAP